MSLHAHHYKAKLLKIFPGTASRVQPGNTMLINVERLLPLLISRNYRPYQTRLHRNALVSNLYTIHSESALFGVWYVWNRVRCRSNQQVERASKWKLLIPRKTWPFDGAHSGRRTADVVEEKFGQIENRTLNFVNFVRKRKVGVVRFDLRLPSRRLREGQVHRDPRRPPWPAPPSSRPTRSPGLVRGEPPFSICQMFAKCLPDCGQTLPHLFPHFWSPLLPNCVKNIKMWPVVGCIGTDVFSSKYSFSGMFRDLKNHLLSSWTFTFSQIVA